MWKTWKSWFFVAVAGKQGMERSCFPVDWRLKNRWFVHSRIFLRAWGRHLPAISTDMQKGQESTCRLMPSIIFSPSGNDFPAIGYKNPPAGCAFLRRVGVWACVGMEQGKGGFSTVSTGCGKTPLRKPTLFSCGIWTGCPHPCHRLSLKRGVIRPRRSACGSGRSWRRWQRLRPCRRR